MTTDVDSPTGNKDADSPNATPEVRQSTGAHDLTAAEPPADVPGAAPGDVPAAAALIGAPGDLVGAAPAGPAADGPVPAPAGPTGGVRRAAQPTGGVAPAARPTGSVAPSARQTGSVSQRVGTSGGVSEAVGSAGGVSEVVADPAAGTQEVPRFGWDAAAAEDETFFRFPAADDPDPGWPRLLGMSFYAAILGLAGVGVGVRGLAAAIGSSTPAWYVPLLAGSGLLSVGLTVAAFLSIHRHLLPWLLLLAAAVPLGTAVILAVAY